MSTVTKNGQGLTVRQQEVLEFVGQYSLTNGYPPTANAISLQLGVSDTQVRKILGDLRHLGLIRPTPLLHRGKRYLREARVNRLYPRMGLVVVSLPNGGKLNLSFSEASELAHQLASALRAAAR